MYPQAEEIDGSGIWNVAYSIDENNIDFREQSQLFELNKFKSHQLLPLENGLKSPKHMV